MPLGFHENYVTTVLNRSAKDVLNEARSNLYSVQSVSDLKLSDTTKEICDFAGRERVAVVSAKYDRGSCSISVFYRCEDPNFAKLLESVGLEKIGEEEGKPVYRGDIVGVPKEIRHSVKEVFRIFRGRPEI